MVRIAISQAAFDAIAGMLPFPLGSVSYESASNERGERYVWLDPKVVEHPSGPSWSGRELQRSDFAAGGGGFGMSGEDNAQSAICSAARSAARREETNRARGNGRQGRLRAPCVARAHALPTRGSARRTIGYAVRPPAAPGHPLLCGMAPLMPWCDRGAPRALALRPSPRRGAILMRGCRPLPPAAGEANRRGGGRQGRARALRARPPGAPCVRRGRANSPRIPYRRAEAHAADQWAAPAF